MPWSLLGWCCCWLQQDTDAAQLEIAAATAATGVPPATHHAAAAVLTGRTARRIAARRHSSQVPVAPQILCHIDAVGQSYTGVHCGCGPELQCCASTMHVGSSMAPLPGMPHRLHASLNIAAVRCARFNLVQCKGSGHHTCMPFSQYSTLRYDMLHIDKG